VEEDGRALTRTIAAMSIESIASADSEYLSTHLRPTVENNKRLRRIRIWDDDRTFTFQYPPGPLPPAEEAELQVFHSPILYRDQDLPPVRFGEVEAAFDNSWLSSLIASNMVRLVAGTSLTFTLLALALLYFLRRNVLEPVAVLDRQVASISEGDLSRPILLERKDELGRFAGALEKMRQSVHRSHARIEEQMAELKELDRMKDEFLANTSHELKTPLNGIIGLTESFLMGSYGKLDREQEEAMRMLFSCAERLWKMTDSILKFSRLRREDPGDRSPPGRHLLRDHLEEALIDLLATAEKRRVPLLLSLPQDLDVTYCRNELEQVVRILTDNALKFTRSGEVEILAKRWELGAHAGFQLGVRDTGPGIPGSMLERIFEPFTQVSGHETRSFGGVGLGLSIARKLLDRMRAEVVVESTVGRGTTFTILGPEGDPGVDVRGLFEPWPEREGGAAGPGGRGEGQDEERREPEPAPGATGREAAPSGAGARSRVLVVDDERVNREVARLSLQEHYEVEQAADGPASLEILRARPIDLVLLDIMMPGMSGYDVLDAMRLEGLLERTPVVILSAKSSQDAVVKGLKLGASDYLAKPFHREELLFRIGNLIARKRERDRLLEDLHARTPAGVPAA
jgi:two-component system sensor histidine kinase ChiS